MKKGAPIGVYVVLPTPFSSKGDFDASAQDVFRKLVDFVIDGGIKGIVAAGGAGEFFALTEAERKKLFDICVEQAAGRIEIYCGTGAASTREAIDYTKHAKSCGADGVMLVAPYYTLPGPDDVYRFYADVAEAVDIRIMLYNDPFPTGIDVKPKHLARIAEIPNVVSIKESSGDLRRVTEIKETCHGISYLFGDHYPVFDAYRLGADGWVTSSYFPSEAATLHMLMMNKNVEEAKNLHSRLLPILKPDTEGDITDPSLYIANQKAAFELLGFHVGGPRAPLASYNEEAKMQLKSRMRMAGIIQ